MFEEYEIVKIKKNGLIGTIVEKSTVNGRTVYIVESNTKGKRDDGYGGIWPLYNCYGEDLIKIA